MSRIILENESLSIDFITENTKNKRNIPFMFKRREDVLLGRAHN